MIKRTDKFMTAKGEHEYEYNEYETIGEAIEDLKWEKVLQIINWFMMSEARSKAFRKVIR